MTEHDYMVVANLTRVRAIKDLLRMTDDFPPFIDGDDLAEVSTTLAVWEARLERERIRLEDGGGS